MKLLIINGPNMNMLGVREVSLYGLRTYDDLVAEIKRTCDESHAECDFFQSNHEGAIIDTLNAAYGVYDGIVINPAAYSHTSLAIADAIRANGIPTVEVHLTDISSREEYRRFSFTSEACVMTVKGHGFEGYSEAVRYLCGEKNTGK